MLGSALPEGWNVPAGRARSRARLKDKERCTRGARLEGDPHLSPPCPREPPSGGGGTASTLVHPQTWGWRPLRPRSPGPSCSWPAGAPHAAGDAQHLGEREGARGPGRGRPLSAVSLGPPPGPQPERCRAAAGRPGGQRTEQQSLGRESRPPSLELQVVCTDVPLMTKDRPPAPCRDGGRLSSQLGMGAHHHGTATRPSGCPL